MFTILSLVMLFTYLFCQGQIPDAVLITSGMFAIAGAINKSEWVVRLTETVDKTPDTTSKTEQTEKQ